MNHLEALLPKIPEHSKDLRLNLTSVLAAETLTPAQRWGTAVASAAAARHVILRDALIRDAREQQVGEPAIEDALAAASLMGMNNVYYRFRHMIGRPPYSEKPARLRMNRIARPASNKVDFELFSLAVSAINGCEMCIQSHEKVVLEGGLTEDQVHDAVRIAATVHGAAIALELSDVPAAN